MMDTQPYIDRICPVCGKTFLPAPMHIYKDKRNNTLACSYTCMLKSEKLPKPKTPERICRNNKALDFLKLHKEGVTGEQAEKAGVPHFYERVGSLVLDGVPIRKKRMFVNGKKRTVYFYEGN